MTSVRCLVSLFQTAAMPLAMTAWTRNVNQSHFPTPYAAAVTQPPAVIMRPLPDDGEWLGTTELGKHMASQATKRTCSVLYGQQHRQHGTNQSRTTTGIWWRLRSMKFWRWSTPQFPISLYRQLTALVSVRKSDHDVLCWNWNCTAYRQI